MEKISMKIKGKVLQKLCGSLGDSIYFIEIQKKKKKIQGKVC